MLIFQKKAKFRIEIIATSSAKTAEKIERASVHLSAKARLSGFKSLPGSPTLVTPDCPRNQNLIYCMNKVAGRGWGFAMATKV